MNNSLLRASLLATGVLVSVTGCANWFDGTEARAPAQAGVAQPAPAAQAAQAQPTDPGVQALQRALQEAGYSTGPVDGIWGPSTEQALREFQEDQGLEPTGRADIRTLAALGVDQSTVARLQESPATPAGDPAVTGQATMQAQPVPEPEIVDPQQFAQDRESVRELQQTLQDEGYDPGPIDGIWGPRTQYALVQFQQDQGLNPTAHVDVATLTRLGLDDMVATGADAEAALDQGASVPSGAPGVAPGGAQMSVEGGVLGGDQPTQQPTVTPNR